MKNLLIWDIDGTLIQGRGIGRRAMDSAFSELYYINEGFKDVDMAGRLDSVILNDAYKIHNMEQEDPKIFFDTYCVYLQEEIAKLDSPIEAPGVLNLLEELNRYGSFLNVLGTGNIEKAARIKLHAHNMNDHFPLGGFGDEVMERWQVIEKAAIKSRMYFDTDFSNNNIYIIGDTPRDVECGKKLNLRTIAVATGLTCAEDLKRCGADYVFENFENSNTFLDIFT